MAQRPTESTDQTARITRRVSRARRKDRAGESNGGPARQVEQKAVRGQHDAVVAVGEVRRDLARSLDPAEDDEGRVGLDGLPEKLGRLCLTLGADDGALLVLLGLLDLRESQEEGGRVGTGRAGGGGRRVRGEEERGWGGR